MSRNHLNSDAFCQEEAAMEHRLDAEAPRRLRRPHPHQVTDSVYAPHGPHHIAETWWATERHAPYACEDMQAIHGPYEDAAAELERRRTA